MIFVSHALPVNVPDEPRLDRQQVWDGLVLKANNALPFVPAMTYCEVTQRHSDTVFDRDIDFRGQRFTERITLEAPHRVTFTRIAGPGAGHDRQRDRGHRGRPAAALQLRPGRAGVEGGSAEEQEYADSMTGDYLKAVAATLNAMRRLAEDPAGAVTPMSAAARAMRAAASASPSSWPGSSRATSSAPTTPGTRRPARSGTP